MLEWREFYPNATAQDFRSNHPSKTNLKTGDDI